MISASISASTCGFDNPRFHCSSGFMSTRNSAIEISLGSVPSSGRPALEVTPATSGDLRIASRMRRASCCDSVTEELLGSCTLTHTAPSFSSGRNSVPSDGTSASAPASDSAATASTDFLWPSAQASAGS